MRYFTLIFTHLLCCSVFLHRPWILTHHCSDWYLSWPTLQVPATSSAPCRPLLPESQPVCSCGKLSPIPTASLSDLHQPERCGLPRCHGCSSDCAGTPVCGCVDKDRVRRLTLWLRTWLRICRTIQISN